MRRRRLARARAGPAAVAAANALTAAWAGRQARGESTALSGVGVWVLLAALEGGSDGRARAELERAVGLPAAEALAGAGELVERLASSSTTRMAVALWIRDSIPLRRKWAAALPAGTFERLVGDASDNQAALDSWAAHHTDGEIKHVPIALGARTLMAMVSAISVRTQWAEPFQPVARALTSGPWSGTQATLLRRTTTDLEDVRMVTTPTGDLTLLRVRGRDDVDVYLALGEPDTAPEAVLAEAIMAVSSDTPGVAGPDLPEGEAGPGVAVATVESSTPGDSLIVGTVAFDVRASHDLSDHADAFGLEAARITIPGHFPGISPEPLAVGQARQDARARFTHQGFAAAAVTAVEMLAASMPPRETYRVMRIMVTFHRPFGFVAVHRPSSLVLVAGWVNEPAYAPDDHVVAQ